MSFAMEASSSSDGLSRIEVKTNENLFFLISDLHFGDLPQLAVDEFLAEVSARRPTAVVCSGDITQRSQVSEFVIARAFFTKLDQLNIPIVRICCFLVVKDGFVIAEISAARLVFSVSTVF